MMKLSRMSFMCALASLAGCATVEPEPRIVVKTVEVQIPGLPVPCRVDPVPKPAFAMDNVKPGSPLYTKGSAVMAELQQRKAYEEKLEAAVKSCQ